MSYTLDFPIQYIPNPDLFATIGLGELYIGVVDGDPAAEPADRIQVYIARQNDTDLPISQPIELSAGGVPVYLGSPVTLKIDQEYSIAVLDKNGQQVFYSPKSGEEISAINDIYEKIQELESELSAASLFTVDNVSILGTLSLDPGKIIYLRQYNSGSGKGGGHLEAKAGVITPDNVKTFASASPSVYFERINTVYFAEHAGAYGDGITSDSSALIAMHNALGYIRLSRSTYAGGLSFNADSIVIYGEGKPSPNASFSKLSDGSGSIIVGTIFCRAKTFYIAGWGADTGTDRGLGTPEGVVFDAPVGASGINSFISEFASMGPSAATSSHALLHEGFDNHYVGNIDIYHHNFGVVSKSRNGTIENINSHEIKTAAVYPKSSIPSLAGDVANGTASNIQISNVVSKSSSPNALAVWVHSEGASSTAINIKNISQAGGRAALRVTADSSHPAAYINADNINASDTVTGWEAYGGSQVLELSINNASIVNPSSGEMFQYSSLVIGWLHENTHLIITSAPITGTSYATFGGTGQIGKTSVRNVISARSIMTFNISDIKSGSITGNAIVSGEGNLTLLNGAVAAAGEIVPQVSVKAGNIITLTGVINPSAASSSVIASLSGSLSFGANKYFAVVARTTGGAYTTAYVIGSGANLTVLSPAVATLNQIDLSEITVSR